MELKLAQIVYSKKGRDSGKRMIIFEILNEEYVKLVDGDCRKIENPKKKKIKHLQLTNEVIECLNAKLFNNEKIFDHEIRKLLELR